MPTATPQQITPERWQQIKELFHAAAALRPSVRAEFLAANCADDDAMRLEVEQLLAADEGDAHFLEFSPLLAVSESLSLAGKRIGSYKIMREIGRGGMGTVWEAVRDDDQFNQRVALKIIKRGMDTEEMLRRFRIERQILAQLDHPNIARLLDGGSTEDGLPWYAMEFIEGCDIASYHRARQLSVNDLLRLFLDVCDAVQYAHQHLIIHRDLKPSNILVTEQGEARLLDFGIAKLLSPAAADHTVTATVNALMTPAYASPEQFQGGNITTASDVYALGVILYELLTGQLPYDLKGHRPDEIPGIICEIEPERPSVKAGEGSRKSVVGSRKAEEGRPNSEGKEFSEEKENGVALPTTDYRLPTTSLRGDLDNIVLHALRKDPLRRYNSVEQFAEDIRRHLDGRPVIARPDTLRYRTTKFITRNKFALTASALIFLALLGGIIATTWEARVARQQRQLAERRFNEVRQLAHAFVFDYHDAVARLPGSTALRERLVRDATVYLDNLSRDVGNDPELQREVALAYLKLGNVQGEQWLANTGDTAGALNSYRKAVALCEQLAQPPGLSAAQHRQAEDDLRQAYQALGSLLPRTGKQEEGREYLKKSLAISERLFAADTNNQAGQLELSRSYVGFGDLCSSIETRLEMYRKADEVTEKLFALRPDDLDVSRAVIRISQRIGTTHIWLGEDCEEADDTVAARAEYRQALPYHQRVLELAGRLFAAEPQNPAYQRIRIAALINLAITLRSLGRSEEAIKLSQPARSAQEAFSRSDQGNKEAILDLADIHTEIGREQAELKNDALMKQSYRASLTLLELIQRADPQNVLAELYVTRNHEMMGRAMLAVGNPASALPHFLKTGNQSQLARCYLKLAAQAQSSQRRRQYLEAARTTLQQMLNSFQSMPESPLTESIRQRRKEKLMKQLAECEAALREASR